MEEIHRNLIIFPHQTNKLLKSLCLPNLFGLVYQQDCTPTYFIYAKKSIPALSCKYKTHLIYKQSLFLDPLFMYKSRYSKWVVRAGCVVQTPDDLKGTVTQDIFEWPCLDAKFKFINARTFLGILEYGKLYLRKIFWTMAK